MDFVDLDKVLDEFEEEEKAADTLTPGRETKPSGYSAFIESRQDRPWESVSEVPVSSLGMTYGHALPSKGGLDKALYDYDVPYDSGGGTGGMDFYSSNYMPSRKKTLSISAVEFGKGDLDLGNSIETVDSQTRNDYSHYQNYVALEKDTTVLRQSSDIYESKSAVIKTSDDAVKEYMNNSSHNLDFSAPMYSKHNGVVVNEDFQSSVKGLKASQVTAVQTDALTPGTEKELTSAPYPKSDIIVDGHESFTQCVVSSEPRSVVETKPIDTIHHSGSIQLSYANHETVAPVSSHHIAHPPEVVPGNEPSFDVIHCNGPVSDLKSAQQNIVADSLNRTDPSHKSIPVVGFGEVDVDLDDAEVDDYLKDCEYTTKTDYQNQTSNQSGVTQGPSTEQTFNPSGMVLDIRPQGDGAMVQQKSDVQYSHPAGLPVLYSEDPGSAFPQSGVSGESSGMEITNQDVKSVNSSNRNTELFESQSISGHSQDERNVREAPAMLDASIVQPSEITPREIIEDSEKEYFEANNEVTRQDGAHVGGVGARPKDTTAMKKSRPNSLLGLSKINMDSPYNIAHEVKDQSESDIEKCGEAPQSVSSQSACVVSQETEKQVVMENGHQSAEGAPNTQNTIHQLVPGQKTLSADPPSVGASTEPQYEHNSLSTGFAKHDASGSLNTDAPVKKDAAGHGLMQLGIESAGEMAELPQNEQKQMTNLEIRQQIEQEQRQRMYRNEEPVPSQMMGEVVDNQVLNASSGEATSVLPASRNIMDDEIPVMRRTEEQSGEAGHSVQARPHSWSPASGQSSVPGRMKRPTSLNLPPRGEFALVGERSPDTGGRMRTVGRIHTEDIPEENEQSAGEEYSDSADGVMEASGIIDDDRSLPSNDPPPQSIIHSQLGRVAPTWLPDHEAPNCMQCFSKFTFTKRRHHCRACGKVFCSSCCSLRCALAYMDMKEARVCQQCHQLLQSADWLTSGSARRSPNPNNPSEYCSTIPPQQQANARAPLPTVLVPVGVLKREGSQRRTEPKQVMFSDGIRPGGDLTELDGSNESRLPQRRTGRVQKKVEKLPGGQSSPKTRRLKGTENTRNTCLIPEGGLPPLYRISPSGELSLEEQYDPEKHLPQVKDEEAQPIVFALNSNLQVQVKILMLDCCVARECWCFTTRGMCTAGQSEIVIILECFPEEVLPPRDIFCHFATVYEEAGKGNIVINMGHTIFNQSFLDSREHGGFLYLRPTFQCLQKLMLPEPPYLIGVLLQKWETPWVKVFPLRLLLRLGAEYRYYPCPLVSIRNRKPVFFEIGHTIMNLLADFRNYQYMLPQIRGVHIHMEDKKTLINFPRNRYDELMKVVNTSNEHVMALGSAFSPEADSHLVCIQNDDGNYQTQAINIQNKPRKVTGASFVVFNGALKTTSGLRAKSSIVEDGLMVQILPDCMVAVKQAIKDMTDYTISCGPVSVEKVEEVVIIQWVDDDKNFNIGVKSPIDNMSLDGIESVHTQNATDYVGENRAIRWTEVFFIQNEDTGARWEPVDLSRLAETLASATCIALTQHLDRLKEASTTKIGLRVTIDTEQVGYEIGSNGEKLADFYMNDLDSGLIPVIHGAASQNQDGPIVLELIFFVLE